MRSPSPSPDIMPIRHEDGPGTAPLGAEDQGASMVGALVATGVMTGEALGQILDMGGLDAARGAWRSVLADRLPILDGGCFVAFLSKVAKEVPGEANDWLNASLTEGLLKAWPVNDGAYPIYALGNLPWLITLPPDLSLPSALHVRGCGNLQAIPPGLRVEGWLDALACVSLASVGAGVRVGKHMGLAGCRSLRFLGDGLEVGGELELINCPALEALPADVKVGEDLNLDFCISLKALPDNLKVGCHLSMVSCSSLVALPRGLRVGAPDVTTRGDMILRDCPAWNGVIPDDAAVAGFIVLDDDRFTLEEWREQRV